MIKPRFLSLVSTLCALLLASCAETASTYRIVRAPADVGDTLNLDPPLLVLPPGTRRVPDSALVETLLPDIVVGGWRCYGKGAPEQVPSDGLRAAIVGAPSGRGTAMVLRVSGSAAFESPEKLSAAWSAWWHRYGQELDGCLVSDAESAVRLALLARRPARAAETVEALFGFRPRYPAVPSTAQRLPQRAIILRAGVTLCANDVAPYDRPSPRWIATTSDACVTVVNAPHGGTMFAAAAGRLMRAYTGTSWVPGQLYRIGSWSEVVGHAGGVPREYVLVLPQNLPTTPSGRIEPDANATLPLIFGADARDPDSLRIVLACARSGRVEVTQLATATTADFESSPPACVRQAAPGRSDLSSIRPVAFRLGERGIADPRMTVIVNQQALEVAVASTLGDLLDRVARVSRGRHWVGLAAEAESDPARRAELDRGLNASADRARSVQLDRMLRQITVERWFDGRLIRVDLSAVSATADALPLLPGDRISW